MTQNTKTQKMQKKQTRGFVQNWKINKNVNICVLCHNFWSNPFKNQVKMDRVSRWAEWLEIAGQAYNG